MISPNKDTLDVKKMRIGIRELEYELSAYEDNAPVVRLNYNPTADVYKRQHLMSTMYTDLVNNYGKSSSIDEFAQKGQLLGAINSKSIWGLPLTGFQDLRFHY